jgi:hypothetical protein
MSQPRFSAISTMRGCFLRCTNLINYIKVKTTVTLSALITPIVIQLKLCLLLYFPISDVSDLVLLQRAPSQVTAIRQAPTSFTSMTCHRETLFQIEMRAFCIIGLQRVPNSNVLIEQSPTSWLCSMTGVNIVNLQLQANFLTVTEAGDRNPITI